MRKYFLEFIVFVCGAEVMILEMVGSRVLAPYLGTSLFVWTSLIGVILGCLSLGYWQGGKLADRKGDYKTLSLIIFLSAVAVGALGLSKEPILFYLQRNLVDPRLAATVATTVLFGPASILLGMVLPLSSKLKIKSLTGAGAAVGTLYAVSTIGSIFGTFLAGFFLISFFGSTAILMMISASLSVLSLLIYFRGLALYKIGLAAAVVIIVATTDFSHPRQGFRDIDTNYNRVWIIDYFDQEFKSPARALRINDESSSAMFLEGKGLVYDYTKYYRLIRFFHPNLKSALMIGGGAYSYPKDFLSNFDKASIDVVEIDPGITSLAKEYFGLMENPRLKTYNEDGRTFLNRNSEKYDAIFIDAFKSATIPYQLTTKEAVLKISQSLATDGVVMANIISSIAGDKGLFLRAAVATYRSVFPQVLLFPVQFPKNETVTQNILLVALKSPLQPQLKNSDNELKSYLNHLWTGSIDDALILTDDFAPVDYYRMYLN